MAVPSDYQEYVDLLRAFLRDTAALNRLEGVEESSDDELYNALVDSLNEINMEFMPRTTWTISNVSTGVATSSIWIPWNVLKMGATLQILTSVGILSARNTLTYNDSSNITSQDMDVYGRYINYYNVLYNKYASSVSKIKYAYNVNECFGHVNSEWNTLGGDGNDSELLKNF